MARHERDRIVKELVFPIEWKVFKECDIQIVGDAEEGALIISKDGRMIEGWGWELQSRANDNFENRS